MAGDLRALWRAFFPRALFEGRRAADEHVLVAAFPGLNKLVFYLFGSFCAGVKAQYKRLAVVPKRWAAAWKVESGTPDL